MTEKVDFLSWVRARLNAIIGVDELAPHLIEMDDEQLREYAFEVLGDSDEVHHFIDDLIMKRHQIEGGTLVRLDAPPQPERPMFGTDEGVPSNEPPAVMKMNPEDYYSTRKKKRARTNQPRQEKNPPKDSNNSDRQEGRGIRYRQSGYMTVKHEPIKKTRPPPKSTRGDSSTKRMPARRACGCQATLHDPLKNCTHCGYIVCKVEGEGQCFNCGSFVAEAGTIPIQYRGEQVDATAIFETEEFKEAEKLKNRLLRYGKEKAIRTQIIDDQGDFYTTEADNVWLTEMERERMQERAREDERRINQSRAQRDVYINLDFAQGSITEAQGMKQYISESVNRDDELRRRLENERKIAEEEEKKRQESAYRNQILTGHASQLYAMLREAMNEEQQEQSSSSRSSKRKKKKKNKDKNNEATEEKENKPSRLQNLDYSERGNGDGYEDPDRPIDDEEDEDKQAEIETISFTTTGERALKHVSDGQSKAGRRRKRKLAIFSDSRDEGVCLSMHQPWASLLVKGIKRVEGRGWSTKFRGRLWIASAKRQPTPFEISEVEQQYCEVYGLSHEQMPFPTDYPTSALLGCVDLVDCLDNATYNEKFFKTGLRQEENGSPFCFMCENPRQLLLPSGIDGNHKLWKMPKERLKTMQQGVVPSDLSFSPVKEAN